MSKKTKKTDAQEPTATPTSAPAPAPVAQETRPFESKVEEPKRDNIKSARSTVANPVQLVHRLVAEMVMANPEVRRRDLVEAAIKAGCAYYTARTQVQVALKKMKTTPAA